VLVGAAVVRRRGGVVGRLACEATPTNTTVARRESPVATATSETPVAAAASGAPAREPETVASPAPTPTPAPEPVHRFARRGTLRGVVTGPDGNPVEGAEVWAIHAPTHVTEYRLPSFGDAAKSEAERDPTSRTLDTGIGTRSGNGGRFEIADLSTIPGWAVGAYAANVQAVTPYSNSTTTTSISPPT
jgi:hypothetical protein